MKPTPRYCWFTLLLLLTFQVNTLRAQEEKDYFFQKLTTVNGLSSNLIHCVFRDSRGYVWIGTSNGLNRYDGKNIKIYHHNAADPQSLPRESIRVITEDKEGHLWMGADYGLVEFDPLTEQFHLYRNEEGNRRSLGKDHIPCPFIDSQNNLWVGTEEGLKLFDPKSHEFETFLPFPPDSIKKNPDLGLTWALAEDKFHNLWCTGIRGINKFNPKKRVWQSFPFQNEKSGAATSVIIDHDGNFWITRYNGGLMLFHPENGQYESIPKIIFDREMFYSALSEWKDPAGEYWLTILTPRGMIFYNHKSKKSVLINSFLLNSNSKSSNLPTWVSTDRENILWIGTYNGVCYLDDADQAFHTRIPVQGDFPEDKGIPGSIETIYEERDLKMLAFYWARGIGIYANDWKPIRFYPHIPPSETSLTSRDIGGIYKDFRGIYWLTTDDGLVRFDMTANSFKLFMPKDETASKAMEPWLMRDIVPFDSTGFYIRSKGRGICKFDFVREKFVQHLVHHDADPASLPANELRAILKSDDNRLIIVSVRSGLFIYEPKNNTFEVYHQHPDPLIGEALNNLYVDPSLSGNILWLNSAHGLLKFDLHTKRFELFDSRNGLANDFLISSETDHKGHVWVAHPAGISMFDTTTRRFTNYSENNGLVFMELSANMKKLADGNIYIGCWDKLIYFNPDQLNANLHVPQVHINFVQILNQPYRMSIDSVTRKKTIILRYDQNLITVDFSVLNISHPNENGYYYRLDQDSSWHKLNEGVVNLVSLSPGKYVLQVTGSNDSGVMNPKGDVLYITILPPFYQTWWFRVLVVLGIFAIFYMIQRMRIKRIKREEQLKTEFNKQLAQAETKALRAQMNPHFIFNSLNSINS
ncbi:MAG: two-component regulator propeller domain-containing protein, partial [Bacteroidota bacterium]